MAATPASGPLQSLRVVEFGGLGPVPFCGMPLSDLGAEVQVVDREGAAPPDPTAVTRRGRHFPTLDLQRAADRDRGLGIIETADVLLEGFRPGVMERLGLGTDVALAGNPSLVYGRMTGLDGAEAPQHAHNRARGAFAVRTGVVQPAPAPRFSATPGAVQPGTDDAA